MKKIVATVIAVVVSATRPVLGVTMQYVPIAASSGAVVPGVWNSNLSAGKAYADANNIPMLAIYGSHTCGHCQALQTACNTDEFTTWAAKKKIVMVFAEDSETKNFCKPSDSNSLPFVSIYWLKSDGTLVKDNFTGMMGYMPSSEGTTIAAQLINSCEMYIGSYPRPVGEAYLAFTNDYANARLEAEVGKTVYVDVPLVRDHSLVGYVSTNLFRAVYKDAAIVDSPVIWEPNATEMSVRVDVPSEAVAGDEIGVSLKSHEGEDRGNVRIFVVGERENSTKNPLFIGERTADTLGYGEWTMDLDVAMEKYRKEPGSHLVAVASGSLWCPDCVMTDEHVLETDAFKNWAVGNKVILVDIDVPNFPNVTGSACLLTRVVARTSDGYISGRKTLPADELQRYQSGAGYLSRHMVSDAAAAAVLERNRSLVGRNTLDGGWNNPNRANQNRTGIPNFFALDRSGALVGTFETFDAIGPSEFKGAYLNRFSELIALEDGDGGDFPNRCWQTTEDLYPGTGAVSGTLSSIDLVDTFALASISSGAAMQEILVAGDDPSVCVTVNLIMISSFNGLPITMATAKGRLVDGVRVSCAMTPREDYYVQVVGEAAGTLAVDSEAADTTAGYSLSGARMEIDNPYSNEWLSKTAKATLPLYAGTDVAGHIELQFKKSGKVSAVVYDEEGRRLVTLNGAWDTEVSADGTSYATLSKGGWTVAVRISGDGGVMADVVGQRSMTSGICALSEDYVDWVGDYAVALPLLDNAAGYWCGDAYMTLSMAGSKSATASGKMKFTVYLPDGKKISGTSGVTGHDANFGIVPIAKKSGANSFRAAVLVRRSAGSAPSRRALMSVEGVRAVWRGSDGIERECGVYGSFIGAADSLVDASGGASSLTFAADASAIGSSQVYGAPKGVFYDGGAMVVSPETIAPEEKSRDFAFKLNRKTGVFSGRTVVSFSNKEKVRASFSGVMLPGWFSECECQEDDDTVVPMEFLPFGLGQCLFLDRVSGQNVKRSFSVGLEPSTAADKE